MSEVVFAEISDLEVAESLQSGALLEEWNDAIASARQCFLEIDCLATGQALPRHRLMETAHIIDELGFDTAKSITGTVRLQDVYDTQAVLLEVKFETATGEKKTLEVFFSELGMVMHAAHN